ncbi:thioesterase domain-containing protein [Streptomyces viridochromogenes]|nr:thioesterase domain-containing protein [Streptomyces viridochromogenes]
MSTESTRTSTIPDRPVRHEPNPYEHLLCEMFATLLVVNRVGPQDDFFALGGHSMLAVRLQRRLRALLGIKIAVQDLFRNPTPAGLAVRLHQQGAENLTEPLLAIRATGSDRPLFCVHPILGLSWSYASILPHLDTDQPVYGLQATGTADARYDSLDDLSREYLARIRKVQPKGPYRLIGWSLGGLIAHAMATMLQSQGEEVSTLAIVDAYPISVFTGDRDEAVLDELLESVADGSPGQAGSADHSSVVAALHEATGLEDANELVDAALRNDRLTRGFTPREFRGDLLFFTALQGRPQGLTAQLWQPSVAGTVHEHQIQSAHHQMLRYPAADELGKILSRWERSEQARGFVEDCS